MIDSKEIKKKYIILIAEDEIVNYILLQKIIKQNFKNIEFTFYNAKNKEEFNKIIKNLGKSIDIILMDFELEDVTGIELTQLLQKNRELKFIPVIFLTGAYEDEILEKAFDAGAIDFMHKPFKKTELILRLYNQMKIKKLMDELEIFANYDNLTKMYNRRKFFELAEKYFYEYDNIYVSMFDLDHFKRINDTYGHDIGDEALKLFSKITKNFFAKNFNNNYILGRYGGEEFIVIGTYKNKEKILNLFNKYLEEIRKNLKLKIKNDVINITVSIGLKFKDEEIFLQELLKNADELLYFSKKNGRNRITYK